MTKDEARKLFTEKRLGLTEAQRAQLNLQIYQHFYSNIDFSFVRHLHTYFSIERTNEPDTWQIVDRLRREFPNTRIVVPRVSHDGALEHFYFEGLHQLKNSRWGIPEPTQGVPAEAVNMDIVIVPLLAVDRNGNRVGYGKGFYDRFLKSCRPDCLKVGLSFFEPVDDISDIDSYDIPIDQCITPKGAIVF